jgi:hypothetical protein
MAALLNLSVANFMNFGEGLSTMVAIIVTLGIFVYVGWSFYFLLKFRDKLHEEQVMEKFGALYEGLHVEEH